MQASLSQRKHSNFSRDSCLRSADGRPSPQASSVADHNNNFNKVSSSAHPHAPTMGEMPGHLRTSGSHRLARMADNRTSEPNTPVAARVSFASTGPTNSQPQHRPPVRNPSLSAGSMEGDVVAGNSSPGLGTGVGREMSGPKLVRSTTLSGLECSTNSVNIPRDSSTFRGSTAGGPDSSPLNAAVRSRGILQAGVPYRNSLDGGGMSHSQMQAQVQAGVPSSLYFGPWAAKRNGSIVYSKHDVQVTGLPIEHLPGRRASAAARPSFQEPRSPAWYASPAAVSGRSIPSSHPSRRNLSASEACQGLAAPLSPTDVILEGPEGADEQRNSERLSLMAGSAAMVGDSGGVYGGAASGSVSAGGAGSSAVPSQALSQPITGMAGHWTPAPSSQLYKLGQTTMLTQEALDVSSALAKLQEACMSNYRSEREQHGGASSSAMLSKLRQASGPLSLMEPVVEADAASNSAPLRSPAYISAANNAIMSSGGNAIYSGGAGAGGSAGPTSHMQLTSAGLHASETDFSDGDESAGGGHDVSSDEEGGEVEYKYGGFSIFGRQDSFTPGTPVVKRAGSIRRAVIMKAKSRNL